MQTFNNFTKPSFNSRVKVSYEPHDPPLPTARYVFRYLESGPRLGGAAVLYSAGGVRVCAERDRNKKWENHEFHLAIYFLFLYITTSVGFTRPSRRRRRSTRGSPTRFGRSKDCWMSWPRQTSHFVAGRCHLRAVGATDHRTGRRESLTRA
jgi:hypothetical protein